MTPLQLKKLVINILDEHKAENIIGIDIRKLSDIADHMIICSATSSRHIKALITHTTNTLKEHNIKPLGAEGNDGKSAWALLDLGDIIIHIMLPESREFYGIEKMWHDVGHNEIKAKKSKSTRPKAVKPKSPQSNSKAKPKSATKRKTKKKLK